VRRSPNRAKIITFWHTLGTSLETSRIRPFLRCSSAAPAVANADVCGTAHSRIATGESISAYGTGHAERLGHVSVRALVSG
jgi:hypothetical protein